MLSINGTPGDLGTRDVAKLENIHARVELSYCDAAKVGSFAVSEAALPGLRAGDQVYVSSGGTGAYRTVLRVEPIAGGAVMILLDPRHAQVAASTSIK
jgi:hypothetical protein